MKLLLVLLSLVVICSIGYLLYSFHALSKQVELNSEATSFHTAQIEEIADWIRVSTQQAHN